MIDSPTSPPRSEKDLFFEALERPTPGERAAFLDGACGRDPGLRSRVEDLLAAHFRSDSFMKEVAIDAAVPTVPGPPSTEAPAQMIGRYKLLELIGEGGFGEVWMAEQREPVKRRVALKLIKLGMDSRQIVARFEAERQALALMDHPNIAKIYDAGTTGSPHPAFGHPFPSDGRGAGGEGRPYFVMELVRGVKITEYCDQNQLPTKERLDLFIKVCQAIQHAHQKGIIHRDIKPSNILVTLHDGVPVPKVIDFGIAKATQQELTDKTVFTQFQQFIGTPAYISPEQAEMSGLDIDTRADIYSLGVLLYELLVGQTPFSAKEMMEGGLDALRKIIREREPQRPSTKLNTLAGDARTTTGKQRQTAVEQLVHQLQGDLDWIVMKCLEKDRVRRYDTATGLAADVQRYLTNEPVVARPPSAGYRFKKTLQRHKLAFAATAAIALALLAGITVSTWQAVRATRARNAAVRAEAAEVEQKLRAQAAQQEAQQAQKAETAVRQEAEHQLYAARMNLAQKAWDENNLARLRQLLDDTQNSPYRGFEWYYWQQQAHLALRTLRGHLSHVFSVTYSPDGRRIVTGSYDQTAKVWDAATSKELLTLKGHDDAILSVAFSPDGQWIVTGGLDKMAKVWETASGRQIITLKGHNAQVSFVAFSPDGRRIVTGSYDQTVKVWDATTGKERLTLKGHGAEVLSVAFSPDGQRIVTGGDDKIAKVWHADSGLELLTLKGHSDAIWSVAFSPDGHQVVTGSDDTTAKVWDAVNGNELRTLKGHGGRISSVAFSPDGRRIVTGGFDKTAKVWDATSGDELRTVKGHDDWVSSVDFSPDGQRIVTGSGDKTAKVWEVANGRELLTLKGHSGHVFVVAFSSDGQRIVTGGVEDKLAKVWAAASGQELLTLKGHGDRVDSVAFSRDGRRIATGSGDKTAKVWEATSGRELLTLTGHFQSIYSVAFSPDGQWITTGSGDKTAKVWEAASGRELLTLKGHSDAIFSVAFSPDGQRIATGSGDETAKVWETASGRELLTLKGHAATVYSVAFSPDGQRIITGSFDGTAVVWDATSGNEICTLKGHAGTIHSVAFSPDGHRIISAGEDKTAKVWEATSGHELLTLKGNGDQISFVQFSPDGHRIAAGMHGNRDIHAKVWEAAQAKQVVAWQEEEHAAVQSRAPLEQEFRAEQERQGIARERSFIKQWLVLSSIGLAADQDGAAGLEAKQIEGENRLQPKAGEVRSIGGGELKWREVALEASLESFPVDFVINFNALVGSETARSVAYAVCYLRSDAPQRGLQLLVGSDDESKIYLNGKEVYRNSVPRRFFEGQDTVSNLELNPGVNVLVFKLVNEDGSWLGSIRLTDAQGNPVEGVEVTLDPEGKKKVEATER